MAQGSVYAAECAGHRLFMIDHYLNSHYQRHGRGPDAFDCWGLVRDARVRLFNKPMLPSFGSVSPQDKRALTKSARQTISSHLCPCGPGAGAIVTGWCGRLCVHVGIMVELDGRLWVLETEETIGPALVPLRTFRKRYVRTEFFDD